MWCCLEHLFSEKLCKEQVEKATSVGALDFQTAFGSLVPWPEWMSLVCIFISEPIPPNRFLTLSQEEKLWPKALCVCVCGEMIVKKEGKKSIL